MRKLISSLLVCLALSCAHNARAAITTLYAPLTYGCDSATVTFPLTWQFIAGADVSVSIKNTSTQIVTPLTYGVDYIVTGGNFATGSITTTGGYSPCPTTYTITIIRSTPRIQPTSFGTWGPTFSKSFQAAADRLALQIQEAGYLATNGTPGPTGATGATGTVTSNSGFTLTGGNITASAAGNQAINKTGTGSLQLQTAGVTRLAYDQAGTLTMTGLAKTHLPAVGQQVSSSTGSATSASQTYVDVPNATVTITTTGRPVVISLISDGSGSLCEVAVSAAGAMSQGSGYFQVMRGATSVAVTRVYISTGQSSATLASAVPCSSIYMIDTPTAGTYTYKLQYKSYDTSAMVSVMYAKLIAYEL